jgi:hypothetical protein
VLKGELWEAGSEGWTSIFVGLKIEAAMEHVHSGTSLLHKMNSTGIFSLSAKRSQPFVKILDNKLTIVKEIEQLSPDTRVVSILGKARMGKSTFLNLLITSMKENQGDMTNQNIFTTQDSDEHCTRGIDAYYLPEKNLLLLDSQGLAYEDSSHDPQLLLFLYHVSDVVIFNDNRRLENGALKLLEPICTFTNYLDLDEVVKPRLFFRIADSDVKEPGKNLEKVLGTYQDQYQSIRDSIRHLFHADIRMLPTAPLDKLSRSLLNGNEYKQVLEMDELGFREACQIIEDAIGKAEKKSKLAQLQEVIGKINGNEEIKIEKLDIVKLQAEREMTKWRDANVSPALYMPIEVDGTQKSFDDNVKPRKNMKQNVLTNFTRRFKAIPESIRESIRSDLDEKLGMPIREAVAACERKAEERVASVVAVAYADKALANINSMNNSLSTIPDSFWDNYFRVFEDLRHACEDIYGPVKDKHVEWVDSVETCVKGVIEKLREEECGEQFEFEALCKQTLEGFQDWAICEMEKKFAESWLTRDNYRILDELGCKRLHDVFEVGRQLVRRRHVSITQVGRKMRETVTIEPSYLTEDEFDNYDLIHDAYAKLVEELDEIACDKESVLRSWLVMKKEEMLAGKMWRYSQEIIKANPEITFVQDTFAFNCDDRSGFFIPEYFYMTEATFHRTYNILYEKCFDHLVKKEYAQDSKNARDTLFHIGKDEAFANLKVLRTHSWPTSYKTHLKDLFLAKLKKEYCKAVVSEFQFPTLITIS